MRLAARSGISGRVTFAGFQTDVAEYLSKMHLFVLPSRTEGLGIVLLEAMAMGLPVVASNVGGIPELVLHNETGLLVQPLQFKDLAEAMIELLSDPKRMYAMGEKGKESVSSKFSAEQFIRQHESVYESALMAKRAV
jgi:glycosyltransferase involved in cell wall biosynthesis